MASILRETTSPVVDEAVPDSAVAQTAVAQTAVAQTAVAQASATPTISGQRVVLDSELIERLQPLTLSSEKILPVPSLLLPLFPLGGLQQGWSVGVAGAGAWSLAMAIWAEALGPEGWVAIVGSPNVGLAAGADLGLRLDRLVVVETPPAGQWSATVAALLEAFDIVAIDPLGLVGAREARRLHARAREKHAVLFHLDGGKSWPTALDLTLTGRAADDGWTGIGRGHGFLRSRRLMIDAIGRRTGHPRTASVLLPDERGGLGPVANDRSARSIQTALAQT